MEAQNADATAATLVLDEFDEGISRIHLKIAAQDLELEDSFFNFPRPLQVSLEVSRSINTFTVSGRISGPIRSECCRCLAAVEKLLEAPMRMLFQRKQASEEELEAVATDENMEICDPGTREIDLKDHICDAIVLELPLRIFCSDTCRGLCPQCGHDLNKGDCSCKEEAEDPRWAALKNLKFF
jgi:uncharacterized protein